jgi:hypothetical protein
VAAVTVEADLRATELLSFVDAAREYIEATRRDQLARTCVANALNALRKHLRTEMRGRDIQSSDDSYSPGVAVINERAAGRYWPVMRSVFSALIRARRPRSGWHEEWHLQLHVSPAQVIDQPLHAAA